MSQTPILVQVLNAQATPATPVWLMRQAGRYMPEYRALKERYTFLEMCQTPELALQVSLQPIDYLDVDAAIIFSDILLPLIGMGLEVDFNPGPVIHNRLKNLADINALKAVNVEESLTHVLKAISMLKAEIITRSNNRSRGRAAVIGFAAAPWTLACYALDQGPYKHFQQTEILWRQNPQALKLLLDKLTLTIEEYLIAQYEAGADAVQIFDTWAGNLSEVAYREIALPYTAKIISSLKAKRIPTILYVNNSSQLIASMIEANPSAISIDATADLLAAYQQLPTDMALQGNFNPADLFGKSEDVTIRAKQMRAKLPSSARYIANLGHGVLQTTQPENVLAFVKALQDG